MTRRIVALCVTLCSTSALVNAQSQSQRSATPSSPLSPSVSLRALLQLQEEQDAKLNRLYDEYARRRVEQERRFASRQNGRGSSREDQLRRQQIQAQQTIADTLLTKRKQALNVLGAVQRAQLQAYSQDTRFELKRDRYYQLLILPVEEFGQAPLDEAEYGANSGAPSPYLDSGSRRSPVLGSYGAYGGYSYGGPSYGVYGTVGRGSTGVQVGIGNRGPSIGIGIGRVFGGFPF